MKDPVIAILGAIACVAMASGAYIVAHTHGWSQLWAVWPLATSWVAATALGNRAAADYPVRRRVE